MLVGGYDPAYRADFSGLTLLERDADDRLVIRASLRLPRLPYLEQISCMHRSVAGVHLLAYDATGIGDPIGEMLPPSLPSLGFVLTGSGPLHWGAGRRWTVGKAELIGIFAQLVRSGRLHVAESCPGRGILREELSRFIATPTGRGRLKFEAPRGHHDDVVLSCALACLGMAVLSRHRITGQMLPS